MKNSQPEAFTSVICNPSLIFLVLQQSLFPLVYAIILGSPSYQRQVLNERCIAPLTFTALRSWRGPERCLRFCNPFVNSAYFYTSGFLVVKYLAWFLYDTVDHPGCLSFRYDCDNPNKNNNIFHLAIKCKTNPWIKKKRWVHIFHNKDDMGCRLREYKFRNLKFFSLFSRETSFFKFAKLWNIGLRLKGNFYSIIRLFFYFVTSLLWISNHEI